MSAVVEMYEREIQSLRAQVDRLTAQGEALHGRMAQMKEIIGGYAIREDRLVTALKAIPILDTDTELNAMRDDALSASESHKRECGGMSDEYSLIVSFPDQSETFVLGFEAGMIWEKLQAGVLDFDLTIHTANTEVIQRMCEASKVIPTLTPTEFPEWTNLSFRLRLPAKPNLRLVKP